MDGSSWGLFSRYIGQTTSGGGKIPSIVCYDSDGTVVAVGPETDVDTNPELLEVEDLVRVEWWVQTPC
jgi:hypothetical protein